MGVLLVSGHAEVWQLIALQACGGAAVAFYSPASYGLVREVVPRGRAPAGERAARDRALRGVPARRGDRRRRSSRWSARGRRCSSTPARTRRARSSSRGSTSTRSRARGAGFLRELREGWSAFVEQTWVWVLVVYVSLYFLITYAPFFVLGPYVAKHSMDGARSWAFVVTGEGDRRAARRAHGPPLAAATAADGHDRPAPDGHARCRTSSWRSTPRRSCSRSPPRAPGSRSPSARWCGTRRCSARSRRRSSRASRRTPGWARWSSCPPATRSPGRSRWRSASRPTS